MDDIRARVAYLNGLAEGLQIDASSPEGRVLSSVIDVLGDLAEQMTGLAEAHDEMADYVEDLDYDLGALEEAHYDNRDEVIRFVPATDLDDVDDDDVEVVCECGETDAFDGHHTHAD